MRKICLRLFYIFKSSTKRNFIILISLLLVSVVFSALTIYASSINLLDIVRERTTLIESLAEVSVVRVENGKVEEALEKAINYIGGIESIVPEGSKVLIKPNIVQNQPPPDTIDPTIIKALINIVKQRNPSIIWVADGSGVGDTLENMRSLGYFSTIEEAGVRFVDLNYGEMVNVSVPGGGIVFDHFIFNRIIVEADVFISVACMKTHSQAVVTLGMKNLIGLAPGSVYGFPKSVLHQRAREKEDWYMAGVIVDLCRARRIDLVVIDGRVGMEGEGPHDGTPVELGLIIVGRDPVATDSVASFIMGFDPQKVPTLKLGSEVGLGINDLHRIEVVGERLEDVFHPFKCANGHSSFQIFPESYIMIYRMRKILFCSTIIMWVLTSVFIIIWRWRIR